MAKVYFSIQGGTSGGPSVWVSKMTSALTKRGHRVIYNRQPDMDVAVMIISAANMVDKVKGKKTRVLLRIDGIYQNEYNQKFNRAVRPDMTALHDDLKKNIPRVHHTVYQSKWSRDQIWDEIVKVDKNYSIIHNGVDINLFKPAPRKQDGCINLIHTGLMRNDYLMEMLTGTYHELKRRGHPVKLILIGSMDGGCRRVLDQHMDSGIKHIPKMPNGKIAKALNMGDIYLDVRQGSSCNNTVAEAQACGIPVITSSWGGDCEMIVDGQTGVVVPSGHWDYDQKYVEGLSNAVEKIIPDLGGYKKRARQHAAKNLNLDVMVTKYLKAMGV